MSTDRAEVSDDIQSARAQQRIHFLRALNSLIGRRVEFCMRDLVRVSGVFAAYDRDILSVCVDRPCTPQLRYSRILLRTTDVLSMRLIGSDQQSC